MKQIDAGNASDWKNASRSMDASNIHVHKTIKYVRKWL